MKNGTVSIVIAITTLLSSLLLLSCRLETELPQAAVTSPRLVALAITPSAPSIAPGSTLQLEALGIFSNSSSRPISAVTWTSTDPLVASVNSEGLVSAPPASSGSTLVTAASGSIVASTVVTVSPLAAITLSPQIASVAPGTAQTFVATAILANSAQQDITQTASWTSSAPAVAAVTAGLATAGTGTTGTTTVSATLSGITGTAMLTSAELRTLQVSPGNASVVLGTSVQFRAVALLSDDTTQDLTRSVQWFSSPQTVASVSATGLAVGNAQGTAVISAAFGSVPGSALLTVTGPVLSTLRITPANTSVPAGSAVQFTALGLFSDGTQQDVTQDAVWASSDPAVALVDNGAGTKGRASTFVPGTTHISAEVLGVAAHEVLLTVTAATSTTGSITLRPREASIRLGEKFRFVLVRVSPSGTVLEDLTNIALWNSSNAPVAFVSQGEVFAVAPGSTVISASTGTEMFTANVTVTPF